MRWFALFLAGCNFAPVGWDDYGKAGGAIGEWGGLSEICGPDLIAPGDLYIDGYFLCLTQNDLIPLDDPIHVPCDQDPLDTAGMPLRPKDEVFYVYDGVRARGYPIDWMKRREAIHDVMGRVPVLVDW